MDSKDVEKPESVRFKEAAAVCLERAKQCNSEETETTEVLKELRAVFLSEHESLLRSAIKCEIEEIKASFKLPVVAQEDELTRRLRATKP